MINNGRKTERHHFRSFINTKSIQIVFGLFEDIIDIGTKVFTLHVGIYIVSIHIDKLLHIA